MRTTIQKMIRFTTLTLFFVMACMTVISAQGTVTKVSNGERTSVEGIITARAADSFTMTTFDNTKSYVVALTPDTSVRTNTRGVFRGGRNYEVSYLLRGLRVQVEGIGNAAGEITANSVRFNETDLRTAQSLQSRISPVEGQTAENSANIAANKERIAASEENQKRMAGQIQETQALAAQAQATADRANNRINGLDEFDSIKTIVVPFATGSSTVGPKGKLIIDEAAAWVKTQNTKGWMVAVVGFADSTGNSARNRTLSESRANSVIGYMVSKHNLPLQRLIQPFGAGIDQPVATNDTAAGRAQNRRVEIRLLVNKGIADLP